MHEHSPGSMAPAEAGCLRWPAKGQVRGMMELEICVDSVASAAAAESGGAQRVELCSGLIEGGLTPSLGLIRAVRSRIGIGVHVMIRPRGGDFFYSDEELAVMRDDIALAAQSGVEGVVLGLLTAGGNVDVERTRELVEFARPMEVTFHRAFDMTRDVERSLEDVIATGADRVLTSGGQQTAMLGCKRIRDLVEAADGRIGLMAGGGVRVENVQQIAQATGALEFHTALRNSIAPPATDEVQKVRLGDRGVDDYAGSVISSADVRLLRQAMDAAFSRDQHST
jgi:copper homeostasis protein